ncbi:methyltransferase [Nocardia sp. NPDC058519]|uniref:methyltransferase n=1 Tax=Nocardia sp. NPDC058519 TaxID=3346535 RepID=UPI00365C625A
MTRSLAAPVGIDTNDRERIEATVDFIRTHDTDGVLAAMVPDLTAADHAAIAEHCRFAHAAVLVFPSELSAVAATLETFDLVASANQPSTVVRGRLALRHGLSEDRLPVQILRARVGAADGTLCEIEVFVLVDAPPKVVAAERATAAEAHLALDTGPVDDLTLTGLRALFTGAGKLRADGGGYSPHEDSTVLYFACIGTRTCSYRRLELRVPGHRPHVLSTHLDESEDPAHRLLRQLTGAWTTQALAVAADLGIADRLAATPGLPVAELAAQTGTDCAALTRLMRYLVDLEVVQTHDAGYELTDTGALLARESDRTLRSIASLYGGAFYESFGALGFAIRTGTTAFDHHFGRHHFDYFAAEPERAALFDSAMAASAAIFGQLGHLIDTTSATTVVDVGGGSGELLARVLSGKPGLRGILFERDSTLDRARATFAEADCASRCDLVGGDFFTTDVPSEGDIYLLSRVLHDWNDDDCRTILRSCAAAMSAHARLYVIERLLPKSSSRSLVPAWDLHMLCNVGGRERSRDHYGALAASAGLEVVGADALPLGFAMLCVRHVTGCGPSDEN